jgi:hypothetical protein
MAEGNEKEIEEEEEEKEERSTLVVSCYLHRTSRFDAAVVPASNDQR